MIQRSKKKLPLRIEVCCQLNALLELQINSLTDYIGIVEFNLK